MSDAFVNEEDSLFSPTADEGGNELAWLALMMPVLAGSLLFFVNSMPLVLMIAGATVLTTSILMAVDSCRLPPVDKQGRPRDSVWLLIPAMCAIWIVGYPYAFFRRQAFRTPRLGSLSVIVALYFAFGPFVYSLMVPPGLPSCTSTEVITLLEQIVRNSPVGPAVQSIDGHHEIAFDKDKIVRHGRCVLHTENGDSDVDYFVEWQDQGRGMFQVRIPAPSLPAVTDPQVMALVEQLVRSTRGGNTIQSLDGHQEVRFDEDKGIRFGRCLSHGDSGDQEVRYLVEWTDREKGQFQVRLLATELPSCTSPEVIQLLEDVILNDNSGAQTAGIDGHREIQVDPDGKRRIGTCTVHLDQQDSEVQYVVEWLDRETGVYIVRTIQSSAI